MSWLDRLAGLKKQKHMDILGIMSGTSGDGTDISIARFIVDKDRIFIERSQGFFYPYDDKTKQLILKASMGGINARKMARLDYALGNIFGQRAKESIEKSWLKGKGVDLIASHGQTVVHLPKPKICAGVNTGATLQIGNGSVIAAICGYPVLTDFRSPDVATGGQGAPLVPIMDLLLFSHPEYPVACLNIGGIANITFVPPNGDISGALAFDTGPGNMLSDRLVWLYTGGSSSFDRDGQLTLSGKVHIPLLEKMLEDEYFRLLPPKSCGREEYGHHYGERIFNIAKEWGLSLEDALATAAELTGRSIGDSLAFFPQKPKVIYASGGGVYDKGIIKSIRRNVAPSKLEISSAKGVDPDMKEALAFALLGALFALERPGNVPGATGGHPSILGKLSLP